MSFVTPLRPCPATDAILQLTQCMSKGLLGMGDCRVTADEVGVSGNSMLRLVDLGLATADRRYAPATYLVTDLGREVVETMTSTPRIIETDPPVKRIQRIVSETFGIPMYEMTSDRRSRKIARPRQIAMFLAREMTPLSLPSIGKRFGGRDHTTVMHAISVVEGLIEIDPSIRSAVNELRQALGYEPDDLTDEERMTDAHDGSDRLRDAILTSLAA